MLMLPTLDKKCVQLMLALFNYVSILKDDFREVG